MNNDYDIALSFSGEDRAFVEKIAETLKKEGYSVFYDGYEQSMLWGMDLTEELPKRYERSQHCVVFFSESYMKKMWTRFERQIIVSHFLKKKGKKYLLPVFLDGFKERIPGISDIIGYVSIDTTTDSRKLKELILSVLKDA